MESPILAVKVSEYHDLHIRLGMLSQNYQIINLENIIIDIGL